MLTESRTGIFNFVVELFHDSKTIFVFDNVHKTKHIIREELSLDLLRVKSHNFSRISSGTGTAYLSKCPALVKTRLLIRFAVGCVCLWSDQVVNHTVEGSEHFLIEIMFFDNPYLVGWFVPGNVPNDKMSLA